MKRIWQFALGSLVSAIVTHAVNEWLDTYRCQDCRAWMIPGPNGLRCPRGCLRLARPIDLS
jgi:hypothetical protein